MMLKQMGRSNVLTFLASLIIVTVILLTPLSSFRNQAYGALPFGIPDSSSSTDTNSSTSETANTTAADSGSFLTYSNDALGFKIQ
jgi:hypothetical protein